ncbi:hypothetical protein FGIG_03408 [Fasciola gigantica]|uniref:Uncharacterized protein n=1 Tax=Fasciola gigantica TaxID=46835 RepID=A0A504YPR3_FASGI|nr:hypothetical protein FGIG_03408 [Fasciola gigantica]
MLQALFTYQTMHYRATNQTPAELMFGCPIRTMLSAAHTIPEVTSSDQLERRERHQNPCSKAAALIQLGTFVRLHKQSVAKGRTKLSENLNIESVCRPGTYELDNGSKLNARRLLTRSQQNDQKPLLTRGDIAPGVQLRPSAR